MVAPPFSVAAPETLRPPSPINAELAETLPEKIPLPATSSAAEGVFPIPSCIPDRSPYKKGLNAVDDAYMMNVLSAVGLYTPAT